MVTLKGKDADRFIRKMIKKENSPISKKDRKLARDIEDTMSKLTIVDRDEEERERKRKEIEDKYNPTIPKIDDGLCTRCHKNKWTIKYAESVLDMNHGFLEYICKECYNKQKRRNPWYKAGKKEAIHKIKKLIQKEKKGWISATDWDKNLLNGIKEMEKEKEKK